MATNLAIDQELLNKALEVSGLKTKKDTVNLALKELIARRKQTELMELFGKMDPDPDYDYKKGRDR
ncbi:MAG: type II toxin-antitoxin system VapB family antitoxin [Proteobacteria bacterium]|nr:type II toxin-antitoxin system VapB family antitoxin [Pseudomonadota bacterium]MBU4472373.1 type II toxin-antitoxin system VapB family antitoxin [Pseudomonadota bacterium]MCG2752068.1 type II toxin-antitoxin system VapB family antitoxin [Desulfobacteraceae bacterium]